MYSLELPTRSIVAVITEASFCLAMNIISVIGNGLVCLAVYKNPNLRSNTNLYVIALAASDLLRATVAMPLASAVLITGRWIFGDPVCQLDGFVELFVGYTTPATMGLLAFNRYLRIVKTNHYNKIFSPRKSKIWLSCMWLSLAFYLLISRVTNWSTFVFTPGFAVCSVAFTKTESRITHYCFVLGLFFVLPFFIGLFSYYKILVKIRQHKADVAPSLQNSRNQAGRISVKEINMSCTLSYVAAGFLLCWIPMWAFILWMRFSPGAVPRIVPLTVTFLSIVSNTINPLIYAARNRAFREEFRKLLCWWKVRRTSPEADSCASRKGVRSEETSVTATFPKSLFFSPAGKKERDQRNRGNKCEFEDTVP